MDNRRKQNSETLVLIARILIIVEAAVLTLLCLYVSSIVPLKYLAIVIAVGVLLIAVQIILVSGRKKAKGRTIVSVILSIVLIAFSVVVLIFVRNTYSSLEKTQESYYKTVTTTMNVYVRQDDGYTDISELKGKTFGILALMDRDNTDRAVEQIESQFGEELDIVEETGILSISNALKDGSADAILVNSGYETNITDNDDTFWDWAVLLTSISIEKSISGDETATDSDAASATVTTVNTAPVEDVTMQPFLVYLTGMDTRGDQIVAEYGNSDVNMVVAVNPNTKKVLLVNIPRDYYYYLWGDTNYPDKITHCGCYGVDCSIQTMNSLFGININYYVKVGFNSVINIVDAIGGITVNSDYDMEFEGYSFHTGENYLDGISALMFSRIRMDLPGGDRARGMNQQKVITAIINKISSPEMISNFSGVLNAITSNVVTSISIDDMNAIVKMQLSDMSSWNVESIQVDGAGGWEYCYSLGDANDVMIPDWSTVETAKTRINEVLSGQ